jgi:hypothetical protein
MSDLKGNNGSMLRGGVSSDPSAHLVIEVTDWLLRWPYLRAELPTLHQRVGYYRHEPIYVQLFDGDVASFVRVCRIVSFEICRHRVLRAELQDWGESTS